MRNNSQIANIGYNKDMEQVKKKRGRPKGFSPKKADVQEQVVEAIREVFIEKIKIIEVPAPELKGFELYLALKNQGFPQGGIGQFQEDINGTERVYLPHASEIYAQFAQNPDGWDTIRDHLARAYLELKQT